MTTCRSALLLAFGPAVAAMLAGLGTRMGWWHFKRRKAAGRDDPLLPCDDISQKQRDIIGMTISRKSNRV